MCPGDLDEGVTPSKLASFLSLTFLSSLSGRRDGQERAGIPDSFSGLGTTSFRNIFGMEAESGREYQPG